MNKWTGIVWCVFAMGLTAVLITAIVSDGTKYNCSGKEDKIEAYVENCQSPTKVCINYAKEMYCKQE